MQVATLFRESATLLGASMEAGELHGLKMPSFPEGMKQDANDDGYETSVDHFDVKADIQEQGKLNQHILDQHLNSTPEIEKMHHIPPLQQNVSLTHRLQVRYQTDNQAEDCNHRLNSIESSAENHSQDGNPLFESQMPILEQQMNQHHQVSQDSRVNSISESDDGSVCKGHLPSKIRSTDLHNQIRNVDSIVKNYNNQNHENNINSHDNRISNHDNTQISNVGNRLVSISDQMTVIESQLRHNNVGDIDHQIINHDIRLGKPTNRVETSMEDNENHLTGINSRIGRENHLGDLENQMTSRTHLPGTINLDKRVLSDRENFINGLETRIINRDNCLSSLDRQTRIQDGQMPNLDERLLPHENHFIDSRTGNRDNHFSTIGSLENQLNNFENRLKVRENHGIGRLDSRILLGENLLESNGNSIASHVAHLKARESLQPHLHIQSLHHSLHPHHFHHPHQNHHGHSLPQGLLKCDSIEDPYCFVEDDPTVMSGPSLPALQSKSSPMLLQTMPKKRGRKKKIKAEERLGDNGDILKKENESMKPVKERKKHDRFNGMPEEEVVKRTLPDHLTTNLDIVIIGINPGLFAAYKGHHYAGPGNHFWKCLYLSGLTPEPMTADDDYKLLSVGIGFTNMVARATKGSADLTRKEIKEGSQILLEKLQKFKPKIAVFNGKLIYEVFSGNKDFHFGRQPDFVDGTNTYMWVMPSSSARCAQLPRAADKVPFYAALKKFRDYLNGLIAELDESEVVFNDQKLKTFYESDVKIESKNEQKNYYSYSRLTGSELTDLSNSVVKKEIYDSNPPEKKKRGRPKKIKIEGEEPPPKEKVKKEKLLDEGDTPKKKRGRPKKIKTENGIILEQRMPPQNMNIPNGGLNVSDHTSSSNPTSSCFSPPIQSPSGICQGFSPAYTSQTQNPVPPQYNARVQSPAYHPSPHHHPSPLHTQYSQSPPPASQSQSQPFTHSDLSSEISAAISSEHLGSPPPTSPSLGPPDFEPPTSMPDDTTTASLSVKEEQEQECRFSPRAPSESTYQYQRFSESEIEPKRASSSSSQFQRQSSPEFVPKRTNQDVSSKSLSGLESLVDQIPSITEGTSGNSSNANQGENFESQSSGQYEDYLGYPGYSSSSTTHTSQPPYTHYTSSTNYSTTSYLPPSQSSFSVSSLTNAIPHGTESQVASSFSVSSLASNYTASGYPNLMSASHLVMPQPGLFSAGMNMTPNYQYPSQYPTPSASFTYPPHPLHVPSPNYPPYSPYSNSSYPQPYLANHVLDRIKQERMDIGFGGF